MVIPKIANRNRAKEKFPWTKVVAYSLPAFILFVLFIFLLLPQDQDPHGTPAESNSQVQEIDRGLDENGRAYRVAAEALSALKNLLGQLDRKALQFERDRVRGTYGTDIGRLLKYWDQWSDGFLETMTESAREFDINVEHLDGNDLPTPVHVAYRIVSLLPFEMHRTWEDGHSIEDLPARLGADAAINDAMKWLKSSNR